MFYAEKRDKVRHCIFVSEKIKVNLIMLTQFSFTDLTAVNINTEVERVVIATICSYGI